MKYTLSFQEIFQEEGLYKAESFSKGFAFKIKKNAITGNNELLMVFYETADKIIPVDSGMNIYDGLFTKQYAKVFTRNQLFK